MPKKSAATIAHELLRSNLPEGIRVYTTVKQVSSSGTARTISLYAVREGEILDISAAVARALAWKLDKRGNIKVSSIKVSGCGMDMCFHTVYTLSQTLFTGPRSGYKLTHVSI